MLSRRPSAAVRALAGAMCALTGAAPASRCRCSRWPPVSAHIAPGKARTAALGRRESKVYEDMVNGGRTAFLSAPGLDGLLEGGVPIMKDGQCIGAVGVSGVKSAEDSQVARAGIAALGDGFY